MAYEKETPMRLDNLERAVEEIRTGYEELRGQLAELREMISQTPTDPLEESFRSFKERAGVRREAALRNRTT